MDFNHGSDLHLPHHPHSVPFIDSAPNVYSLDPGGTQHHHHQPQAQAQALTLDSTGDMPLPSDDSPQFRRDSINSCALSPSLTEPKWEDSRRASFASTNPFRNDMAAAAATPFRNSMPGSVSATGMPPGPAPWFDHQSNTASPLSFEPYNTSGDDLDFSEFTQPVVGEASSSSPAARRISAPVPFPEMQGDNGMMDNQSLQSPRSPNSNPDWMALAAKDQQGKALPRHMRVNYRPPRPTPSRAASDGIRKKNARIDIPADRNLNNIDELIDSAQDDEEIKELKAQRRLLRNREAALASRQRKKQHTEELEGKETRYLKQISDLEHECHAMNMDRTRVRDECAMWHQKYVEACQVISGYELEKEELIMQHTQETGKLRRQIQYLQLDSDHMSGAQEGLGNFTNDMNAALNPYTMPDMTAGYGQVPAATQNNTAEAVKPAKRTTEQPIASGVLFMILLCGAFVASKTNSRHIIPQMPDEVRVASTTVLDTLLKDPAADAFTANTGFQSMMPHHVAGPQMSQTQGAWDTSAQNDGRQTLYRSMTMPTGQPNADQLFALTPNEYHSLTSPEGYVGTPAQSTPTPRRNLAEALASLRQESISKGSPAEVYSRSLLWDQIPVDVVRQFKELVRDSGAAEATNNAFAVGQQMKHEYDENPMWNTYQMGSTGYDEQNA